MTSIFGIFDWPKSIMKVLVTPGYTDISGNWVPESTTETVIVGHISDVSQREMVLLDPGLIAIGVRKFACERTVGLTIGGRLKITELDGSSISEWIIHTKQNSTGFLKSKAGIDRETFLLKRKT